MFTEYVNFINHYALYLRVVQMSRTVVIGVRIPKELKEDLEKLGIDYASEIRSFLNRLVREKKAELLIKEMDEFTKQVGRVKGNLAAEFIRKDRDAG
jgi:antitoxin component of RelBE/YafQ-DinJ toxin-antitoxin module